jgi:hypothetical protein
MVTMDRRPMQHIDRKDLYTNLESRLQYLQSFLDFGSRMLNHFNQDTAMLTTHQETSKPLPTAQSTYNASYQQ